MVLGYSPSTGLVFCDPSSPVPGAIAAAVVSESMLSVEEVLGPDLVFGFGLKGRVLGYSPLGVLACEYSSSPLGVVTVAVSDNIMSSVDEVLGPDLTFRGAGAGLGGAFLLPGASSSKRGGRTGACMSCGEATSLFARAWSCVSVLGLFLLTSWLLSRANSVNAMTLDCEERGCL